MTCIMFLKPKKSIAKGKVHKITRIHKPVLAEAYKLNFTTSVDMAGDTLLYGVYESCHLNNWQH